MKTLSSAEADFRSNERDINTVQDFWTDDVSGLYGLVPVGGSDMIRLIEISAPRPAPTTRLVLHWEREDRRATGIVGTEDLILEIDELVGGKLYRLPDDRARATYRMATPAKGEGAKAVDLEGSLRVDEVTGTHVALTIDLAARMSRLDVVGEFDERVRGSFRLARR